MRRNLPADGRAGHRRDDARLEATEEALEPIPPLDDRSRLPEAFGGANLRVSSGAPRLQQSLDHIERSRHPGRDGSSQASRDTVGDRIIAFRGVHDLRDGLVGGELDGREGDGHGECRGVGHVEGPHTFRAVHRLGALGDGLVDGTMDLHTLLDD